MDDADAPIGVLALSSLRDEMVAKDILIEDSYENWQNGDVTCPDLSLLKFSVSCVNFSPEFR